MKIPKGMTEEKVLEVIDKIADRYAYKFRFGYFEADDIRQEAKIIAMDALDRYEEGRPLENFLAVHVKNRLNNFKRDKYYRQTKIDSNTQEKHNNSKRHLMEPLDINNIRDGCYVAKPRRQKILEEIDIILRENGYEEGQIF